MRPLRRSGQLLSLAVGALLAALATEHARAQSDPARDSPLQSAFEERDDSRALPKRKPGAAEPLGRQQYGNAPGSGAGSTGFVSTNTPRAKPKKPARSAVFADPPRLRGPILPSQRRGATLDPPATTAAPLIRRRSAETDPFDPLGIRVGSFIVRPAIESYIGHDSNAQRVPGGKSSWYSTVAPELLIRSDWNRHALNADIRTSYSEYYQTPELTRPMVDARVNGRIDIATLTRADLELHEYVSTTYPGSPDLPAGAARLPLTSTTGGSAALVHQFNRLEVAVKGGYDRVLYENALLTNGTYSSNEDRNYDQYSGQARVSYELTPGMKPFVDVQADTRRRDLPIDAYGLQRSSDGTIAKIGSTFEWSRTLTGEASVGYLYRRYKDPTLPELQGFVFDASLIWLVTGLTTAKFTAVTTGDETTLPGVAGVLRHDFALQVDHAFRRWLVGTARVSYATEDYQGSTRFDQRSSALLGLTYKLNREWQIRTEFRRDTLRSNSPGVDYVAYVAMLGLRVQR